MDVCTRELARDLMIPSAARGRLGDHGGALCSQAGCDSLGESIRIGLRNCKAESIGNLPEERGAARSVATVAAENDETECFESTRCMRRDRGDSLRRRRHNDEEARRASLKALVEGRESSRRDDAFSVGSTEIRCARRRRDRGKAKHPQSGSKVNQGRLRSKAD
jgi:hypothetical protein